MNQTDYLIIGAGISGLLCATELQRAGCTVRVVDKGRGFGGRMATRRMAGGRLDHGAQFFTVREKRFQQYVDEWLDAKIIREWFRYAEGDDSGEGHPRYCGFNGMTDVPKFLGERLEVNRSVLVTSLSRESDTWIATTEAGAVFRARHLVITAPLPQAMQLLDSTGLNYAGTARALLREVHYEKGLATLAILDGPSGLPEPGGMKLEDRLPLTWIADNQIKGISSDVSAITLHADGDFAAKHWDSPDEVRGPLMLEAAGSLLKANVVEYCCHRWGYTLPVNPWPEPYFQNRGLQLTLAGDAFGGARIEGAAMSGLAAADAILSMQAKAAS